jgi:ribonuclease III
MLKEHIPVALHDELEEGKLLRQALTRRAFASDQQTFEHNIKHQDELRTLGDAVIKLFITDELLIRGVITPMDITVTKQKIENKGTLADIGRTLGLNSEGAIILGKGEIVSKLQDNDKVLAETLESVVGALFRLKGYSGTNEIIKPWFEHVLPKD